MEVSWPEAVLCLGITAIICVTLCVIAFLASKKS